MGKARAPFRLRQVLHSGWLGALRLHRNADGCLHSAQAVGRDACRAGRGAGAGVAWEGPGAAEGTMIARLSRASSPASAWPRASHPEAVGDWAGPEGGAKAGVGRGHWG